MTWLLARRRFNGGTFPSDGRWRRPVPGRWTPSRDLALAHGDRAAHRRRVPPGAALCGRLSPLVQLVAIRWSVHPSSATSQLVRQAAPDRGPTPRTTQRQEVLVLLLLACRDPPLLKPAAIVKAPATSSPSGVEVSSERPARATSSLPSPHGRRGSSRHRSARVCQSSRQRPCRLAALHRVQRRLAGRAGSARAALPRILVPRADRERAIPRATLGSPRVGRRCRSRWRPGPPC